MNLENLTADQRKQRANIRNFFMVATAAQLQTEIEYRNRRGDLFGASCLLELLNEGDAETALRAQLAAMPAYDNHCQ